MTDELIGWRVFKVGNSMGHYWLAATTAHEGVYLPFDPRRPAECRPGTRCDKLMKNAKEIFALVPPPHPNVADNGPPHVFGDGQGWGGNGCGYYAYHGEPTEQDVRTKCDNSLPIPQNVVAVVRAEGKYVKHEEGFRAQYHQLVKVYSWSEKLLELLAVRYEFEPYVVSPMSITNQEGSYQVVQSTRWNAPRHMVISMKDAKRGTLACGRRFGGYGWYSVGTISDKTRITCILCKRSRSFNDVR